MHSVSVYSEEFSDHKKISIPELVTAIAQIVRHISDTDTAAGITVTVTTTVVNLAETAAEEIVKGEKTCAKISEPRPGYILCPC